MVSTSSTDAAAGGSGPVERLLDALLDARRCERTVAAILGAYVALWTLYAVLSKGSQDIHPDMSEQFALGRDLAWGYAKHPPLAVWIVRAWFAVFPTADWAFYLLAMTNVGVTLWIIWRLSSRYLDGDKRVVGLALLTFVPFFNFHALKFNANTVLMPIWAAATVFFLVSFETRRALPAALAGLAAAAAMYGKYWSIVLVLGLGIAALVHPARKEYLRSGAPWISIAVGALALAPQLAWLGAHAFEPFAYATTLHASGSLGSALRAALGYLAGSFAYVAVPLAFVLLVLRPPAAALRDLAWPSAPERRLVAAAFWGVLLVPAVLAPFGRVQLVSLWSMSAWTLLPVMLLGSPLVAVSRALAARVLTAAAVFPLMMVAIAPAIAAAIHRAELLPGVAHPSLLAEPIARLWHETTNAPLQMVSSIDEFTDQMVFYLPEHPRTAHVLERTPAPELAQRIAAQGILLLCPAAISWCVDRASALAQRYGGAKRAEVTVARRHFGVEGAPARYITFAIPPGSP